MKLSIQNNTMFFYHVITVGLTLIVSLMVGNIVAQKSKHHLITSHIDMYSIFVSHTFEEGGQTAYRFFASPPHTVPPAAAEEHLETLLQLESVIQAKV